MKKQLSSAVTPRRVCASFRRIKTWFSISSTFWLSKAGGGGQSYLWAGLRAEITVPTVSPLPQGNNGPPRQRGPRGIFHHRWSPGIKRNWFKSPTAAAKKALLHFNRLHSTTAALIWWQAATDCEIQKPYRSMKKIIQAIRADNTQTGSSHGSPPRWIILSQHQNRKQPGRVCVFEIKRGNTDWWASRAPVISLIKQRNYKVLPTASQQMSLWLHWHQIRRLFESRQGCAVTVRWSVT